MGYGPSNRTVASIRLGPVRRLPSHATFFVSQPLRSASTHVGSLSLALSGRRRRRELDPQWLDGLHHRKWGRGRVPDYAAGAASPANVWPGVKDFSAIPWRATGDKCTAPPLQPAAQPLATMLIKIGIHQKYWLKLRPRFTDY